jgi:hypothetical protein
LKLPSESAHSTKAINLTLLILLRASNGISCSPPHLHITTLALFYALQADDLCYAVFLVGREISA